MTTDLDTSTRFAAVAHGLMDTAKALADVLSQPYYGGHDYIVLATRFRMAGNQALLAYELQQRKASLDSASPRAHSRHRKPRVLAKGTGRGRRAGVVLRLVPTHDRPSQEGPPHPGAA